MEQNTEPMTHEARRRLAVLNCLEALNTASAELEAYGFYVSHDTDDGDGLPADLWPLWDAIYTARTLARKS